MFISWGIIQSAVELGLIYSMVALALFLSYSMLNVCDLSTDGCYTLGCSVGSMVALTGHPVLALLAAIGSGICSGFVTAFLQTRMKIESLLAGIIVNTGLYTINIMILGKATVSLNDAPTVFTWMKKVLAGTPLADCYKLVVALCFVILTVLFLVLFLRTRLGLSIRATGNNKDMVRSSSLNPTTMITIGLCCSNAITALGGCLIGEYNKTCDINMGTGMVTIALASLIIGETIFGKKTVPWRAVGVVIGAVIYRIVVAIALRLNMPATALKLVSAVIVAVAISYPTVVRALALQNRRLSTRGISLYRILQAAFAALTVLFILLSVFTSGSRPLMILLALLCAVFLILMITADRKERRDSHAGA